VAALRFSQITLNASMAFQYQTQRHLTGQANPLSARKIPILKEACPVYSPETGP
jgi:hypothetical protein